MTRLLEQIYLTPVTKGNSSLQEDPSIQMDASTQKFRKSVTLCSFYPMIRGEKRTQTLHCTHAQGWAQLKGDLCCHQISHLKNPHSPCTSAAMRAGKSLNLLGGNVASLPRLTGSHCGDPAGDLNTPDRGPNLSGNYQFMLMAAKDTEEFSHRGALTIKAEGVFSMSGITPCVHAVAEHAGTPWIREDT